jgi:hypothetical protein
MGWLAVAIFAVAAVLATWGLSTLPLPLLAILGLMFLVDGTIVILAVFCYETSRDGLR